MGAKQFKKEKSIIVSVYTIKNIYVPADVKFFSDIQNVVLLINYKAQLHLNKYWPYCVGLFKVPTLTQSQIHLW